jgi:hypothetical protein
MTSCSLGLSAGDRLVRRAEQAQGRFRLFSALASAGVCALWLTGCQGLNDSLRLSNAVLVKIPCDGSKPFANSGKWHFQHALEGPKENGRVNHWYVAWNDQKPKKGLLGKSPWSTTLDEAPDIVNAAWDAFHSEPLLVEPNHTFRLKASAKLGSEPDPHDAAKTMPGQPAVTYGARTTPAWPDVRGAIDKRTGKPAVDPKTNRPVIDPFWYRRDEFSELESTRIAAGRVRDAERIRIGHLDNGLDGDHPAAPQHLVRDDKWANAVGLLAYAQDITKYQQERQTNPQAITPPDPVPPERTHGTHGMGTVGLLAGGRVHLPAQTVKGVPVAGYDGYVGGAPEAVVVPVRVAPWVISLSTAELAYAIDYASRVEHCDVISMSHGGAPSQSWVDAVNAAYDRGTAMFAAESDFFSLSFDPLPTLGLVLPSSPVYPAAFRRVLGVTGVTAEGKSYGRNTLGRLVRAPQAINHWALRGSYGADGTSTVFFRPNHYPDGSELKRGGSLRPQPIAAYTPNVPWLAVRKSGKDPSQYVVDLTGAGTSAATPQVAAAAALWLQKHRREFSKREWNGWQKPEAVYCALLAKAYLPGNPTGPDPYLGAGMLKARQSLGVNYAQIQRMKKPPETPEARVARNSGRTLYFAKSGRDHFDAQRSFRALLGFQSFRDLRYDERADLCQGPMPGAQRSDALRRFLYNTLLLREWQVGRLPDKGAGADALWIEAERRVGKSIPHYTEMADAELLARVHRLCPQPGSSPSANKAAPTAEAPGYPPE